MPSFGTRSYDRQLHDHPSFNADPGMSRRVTRASLTFGSGEVSGANGTFSAFAVGDQIEVLDGSVSNAGFFTATGVDATNQAFLTLDPSTTSENVSCTVRTL
jgi:hypothetical protein